MKRSFFKILILLISCFLVTINASALSKLIECEYSDEFNAWLELSDQEKETTFMPAMCKSNYLNPNINIKGANSTYTDPSFSLVVDGHDTSVKNQGQTNTCWAFATAASIESNLLKKSGKSVTISPGHIELATQKTTFTPGRPTFDRTLDAGGNYFTSAAYILNNWGPIEDKADYSVANIEKIINRTLTVAASKVESEKPKYNINDISYLMNDACDTQAKTEIKKYLVTNGALATRIYWAGYVEGAIIEESTKHYQDKFLNGAYYYYDGSAYSSLTGTSVLANQDVNHGVTIVGWDDTISRNNFSTQPSSDGAWIIKNSYGTMYSEAGEDLFKQGDNGYFYISYEDNRTCSMAAGYYNIDENVLDNAYYYDDLGWVGAYSPDDNSNVIYAANIFSNKTGQKEILKKVTFGTMQVGQKYTVYYAPNGSTEGFVNNVIASGTVDHSGYTSVTFPGIDITTSKFSIVLKLEVPVGTELEFPVAMKMPATDWANAPLRSGVSYILTDEGWADTSQGFMNSIRAYTTSSSGNINNLNDGIDNNGNINLDSNNNNSILNNSGSNNANPNTGIDNNLFTISAIIIVILLAGLIYIKKLNIFQKI